MRYQQMKNLPLQKFNVRVGLPYCVVKLVKGLTVLSTGLNSWLFVVTTNEHDMPMKAPGWPADLFGTGADHSYPRMQDTRSLLAKPN